MEFIDRTNLLLQRRRDRLLPSRLDVSLCPERSSFAVAVERLSEALEQDLNSYLAEPELHNITAHVSRVTATLDAQPMLPFPTTFNADSTLACLAYLLCRALRPRTVVETGVAYGVTSAMILAALHKNRLGTLHSIDLPPLRERASGQHIGVMVPAEYKSFWQLHCGTSWRVLPKLLANGLGEIGLFIHDSSNLQRIQKLELDLMWPHLTSNAAIIVNNIGWGSAVAEFVTHKRINCWFSIEQREKRGDVTGVIVRRP